MTTEVEQARHFVTRELARFQCQAPKIQLISAIEALIDAKINEALDKFSGKVDEALAQKANRPFLMR